MSYILQALERSERERQQREPQDTGTSRAFVPATAAPKRSLFGPAALAVAVLALAIAVYGAVISPLGRTNELAVDEPATSAPTRPTSPDAQADQPEKKTPESMLSTPSPSATPSKATDKSAVPDSRKPREAPEASKPRIPTNETPAASSQSIERTAERKQPVRTAARTRSEPVAAPTRKRRQSTPSKAPTAKKKPPPAPKPATTRTVAKAPEPIPGTTVVPQPNRTQRRAPEPQAAPSPYDGVPGLASLPKDFRQALPSLAINAHMFAETPADRRVVLNMRGYGEGTRLENGIHILAITRDGVVMSYQGQRFRLPR